MLQNAKVTAFTVSELLRKNKRGNKITLSPEWVTQTRVKELTSLSAVKEFLNQSVTCQWILVNIIFKEVYNMTSSLGKQGG